MVLYSQRFMLFNSIVYWLFLPAVWVSYFMLPVRFRWIWLLLASYFFYGFWKLEFAGLMLLTSAIDWYCGKYIESTPRIGWKRFWLWFSIGSNVLMLFMFKYLDFSMGSSPVARWMADHNATAWIIELGKYTIPAGISFYTFQSISYVVDVFRGQEKAEQSLPKFMLYVSFFPQLVAGPIERFGKLHAQLFRPYLPCWQDLRNAARLLMYGLFLKVAVADNLASVVDTYYAGSTSAIANSPVYSCFDAWVASFFFAFQVYTDFFGYSLLAQGSALLFGIHLMDNFNKPFLAKSIPEFWHRWHISLSTWFRDYIFIPVGGNKRGPLVLSAAVLLVFFASGLWHGASATMIAFGLSQGILYLFDRFVFKRLEWIGKSQSETTRWSALRLKIWDGFKQCKTGFFFMLTLIYFRSSSMHQAAKIWNQLWFGGSENIGLTAPYSAAIEVQESSAELTIGMQIPIFLCIFLLLDLCVMKERADVWMGKFALPLRWIMYCMMAISIWIWGGAINHPFVYFQF